MDRIKEAAKKAIKRKDIIWVEICMPGTWVEYRTRASVPDLVLIDPETRESWFPVCTSVDELHDGRIYLPALWESVLVYMADQVQIKGIVINPYGKEPLRLPCGAIREILDELVIH